MEREVIGLFADLKTRTGTVESCAIAFDARRYGDSFLPNKIDSTAGFAGLCQSANARRRDYRNLSTSAGLETRMSWTPSGVKPRVSILGAMWSSMYE